MKFLQVRAFYNDKMYEVSNIDLLGSIRYVSILDYYSADADDWECPVLKLQITSAITLMRASNNVDRDGRTIYDGDIVKTNKNEVLPVRFEEESDYFEIGSYSCGTAYDLTCDSVLDLELLIVGNIHQNRELL